MELPVLRGDEMLNARITCILKEFLSQNEPITSEYLAKVLSVTSRTIRNDIKSLDDLLKKHGATIESHRGTGYTLHIRNETKFRKFLSEETERSSHTNQIVPSFPESRVAYIIKKLLLAEGYVKLDNLADELFVSKTTLQNDFKTVRDILYENGLVVDVKPNYGVKAIGPEMKQRFLMSEYVFQRSDYDFDLMNWPSDIVSYDDLKAIKEIILKQLKEKEIFMSDIALNNLMVHIAIACTRIRNQNYISMNEQDLSEIQCQREYKTAKEIVTEIEDYLHVQFSDVEVGYVTIHLMGTRLFHEDLMDENEIMTFIDPDVQQLTNEILDKIEAQLGLGIRHDQKLELGLLLHLKPVMNRHKFGMNLRNPMLEEIKSNYPIAYEAGVIASTVIEKKIGIQINDNEIGYLALHFGAALERKKIQQPRKKCLIVCASGVGSAHLLTYKLQENFQTKLEIVDTINYYNLKHAPLDQIDFIISTIPIQEKLSVPVVEVKTILSQNDVQKINWFLSTKEKHVFKNYTREEFVFLQKTFQTKEEVLLHLCEALVKTGYVPPTIFESVMERERLAPTSFGNLVAIPHPMVPQAKETVLAICTLKKPVRWHDKNVQFICLLCIKEKNNDDLQEMYKGLTRLLDHPQAVQRLISAKHYDEFLKIIMTEW